MNVRLIENRCFGIVALWHYGVVVLWQHAGAKALPCANYPKGFTFKFEIFSSVIRPPSTSELLSSILQSAAG